MWSWMLVQIPLMPPPTTITSVLTSAARRKSGTFLALAPPRGEEASVAMGAWQLAGCWCSHTVAVHVDRIARLSRHLRSCLGCEKGSLYPFVTPFVQTAKRRYLAQSCSGTSSRVATSSWETPNCARTSFGDRSLRGATVGSLGVSSHGAARTVDAMRHTARPLSSATSAYRTWEMRASTWACSTDAARVARASTSAPTCCKLTAVCIVARRCASLTQCDATACTRHVFQGEPAVRW